MKESRKFLTMQNGDQNGGRKEESDTSGSKKFIELRKSFKLIYTPKDSRVFFKVSFILLWEKMTINQIYN
jgi:hypothetical protein